MWWGTSLSTKPSDNIAQLDTHDYFCRDLCRRSGTAVIAIDYRLVRHIFPITLFFSDADVMPTKAPEHKYPVPLDDCVDAIEWCFTYAKRLNVNQKNLVVRYFFIMCTSHGLMRTFRLWVRAQVRTWRSVPRWSCATEAMMRGVVVRKRRLQNRSKCAVWWRCTPHWTFTCTLGRSRTSPPSACLGMGTVL